MGPLTFSYYVQEGWLFINGDLAIYPLMLKRVTGVFQNGPMTGLLNRLMVYILHFKTVQSLDSGLLEREADQNTQFLHRTPMLMM